VGTSAPPPPDALLLASASPRRRELLRAWGIPHLVVPSQVEEELASDGDPAGQARSNAIRKASDVAGQYPGRLVLGSDTLVTVEGVTLGKPGSLGEAREMLQRLAGRTHQVCTAVALVHPDGRVSSRVARSLVTFRAMGEEELESYLALREWQGRAGGYSVQDRGQELVSHLEGELETVIGLSRECTLDLLEKARGGAPA